MFGKVECFFLVMLLYKFIFMNWLINIMILFLVDILVCFFDGFCMKVELL